jgi:hypothetical protein
MGILVDMVESYLSDGNRELSSVGGTFTAEDFKALVDLLSGKPGYFIVFNNSNAKKFTVWEMQAEEHIMAFSQRLADRCYGYRIGTNETVLKSIR